MKLPFTLVAPFASIAPCYSIYSFTYTLHAHHPSLLYITIATISSTSAIHLPRSTLPGEDDGKASHNIASLSTRQLCHHPFLPTLIHQPSPLNRSSSPLDDSITRITHLDLFFTPLTLPQDGANHPSNRTSAFLTTPYSTPQTNPSRHHYPSTLSPLLQPKTSKIAYPPSASITYPTIGPKRMFGQVGGP